MKFYNIYILYNFTNHEGGGKCGEQGHACGRHRAVQLVRNPPPCSQTFALTWPHLAGRELKEVTLTAQAISCPGFQQHLSPY